MLMMRFPNGLRKALTLSYDDGVEQDIRLMKILNDHGLKCTFNLNSGCWAPEGNIWPAGTIHRRMTRSQAISVYKNSGHEVAVHGVEHGSLGQVPADRAVWEVINDRAALERDFGGIIRGMAYAFGTFSDEAVMALKVCNILFSRTVMTDYSFDIPQDWLRLKATCHHADPNLDSLCDRFLQEDGRFASKLFYLWGHSYEFEQFDNWQIIERFAEKMSGHEDIWYATNSEIAFYCTEYKRLIYSADGTAIYNPTATDFWAENNGRVYHLPAGQTIRIN